MSELKARPFNLLNKIDAQLTFVDRLYEVVVGPIRMVIIGVMVVIICAFVYRFTLDSKLNDLVRMSNSNKLVLDSVLDGNEETFREIFRRTQAIKVYQTTYSDDVSSNSNSSIKSYKLSYIFEEIYRIQTKFDSDVVVSDYSISKDNGEVVVKVSGSGLTFAKIDEYLREIKNLEFVEEAYPTSQTSQRGQTPRFSIDIKIRNQR